MIWRCQKMIRNVCNMCHARLSFQRQCINWTVLRNLKPTFAGKPLFIWQSYFLRMKYAVTGIGVGVSMFGVASCYARKQANIRDLCKAAGEGDIYVLKRLIEEGADVNEAHALGWTALHAAALSGNAHVVKLLLDAGADVIAKDRFSGIFKTASKKGMRVFDVSYMRDECFPFGLKKNADFTDFTPLHYAALSDDFKTIKLLIDAGADPTLKDVSGYCAEEYADKNREFIKSVSQGFAIRKKAQEAEERKRYPIEQRFGEVIVGQEGAINAVASAIRRRENGWCDEEHPLVFLFLGSSGIGKTELAKQLAKYLHKDLNKGFIRLDMSEYQEKHEVAKLIGAPPGYIGHDQGGQLTKKLSAFPQAVVLFDEVDKAHPDVLTVLLQLFDEGRLTDGHGKTIECKDAIFVMTSNLASGEIANHALQLRRMAKEMSKEKYADNVEPTKDAVRIDRNFKESIVYPILKGHFQRDEFLGRITEFVYFLPFSKSELMQLVEKELKVWASRASKNHSIGLSWDNDILDVLADGYDIHYGARSIKHEVERKVVNQIAAAHERDIIKQNSNVHLVADFPKVHENPEDTTASELRKPTVKIQLIQDGDDDDTSRNVKEIFLEDFEETNNPIFF